jgi:hypothetical protein
VKVHLLIRGSPVQVGAEEQETKGFMKKFIDPFLMRARLVQQSLLLREKKTSKVRSMQGTSCHWRMDYYDSGGPKIKKSTFRKELRREFAYATKMSRIVRGVNVKNSILRAICVFPFKRLEKK